ncbi:formyltransferase family protein [Pseudomonas arcuscaelestis]|uniref:formyltransferase family protein n=1 Tax=Pseudomonas arcuscaelestis TaxID=2710591 RepID=UPI00193E4591|nr:formyltransferase family protein [Pseudomonas arcuscaelestis]MBM3111556.1 hypothetical protein [Pseudomonas arcuscaelestis]
MIDSHINRYVPSAIPAALKQVDFDTATKLIACARQAQWSGEEFATLEFLSKRIEISKCLYESYLISGGRANSNLLALELMILALPLLLKDMQRLMEIQRPTSAIKRLNAALKLLDFLKARNVELDKELVELIHSTTTQFLQQHAHTETSPVAPLDNSSTKLPGNTLAVTVLFWEGPIARAYLAMLKDMGLKAEKIIHLVSRKDLASKKPVGRLLPGALRLAYAQYKQRNSIHHWSSVLQRSEANLCRSIRAEVEKGFGVSATAIDDALALHELSEYSSNVEQLLVDDLADETLYRHLAALSETQILFTGGGIVPRKLLELKQLKYIHIHPGFLPEVRGADCALWSHLMKGRTSATCFYMAPGIDDGDVIHPTYLPALTFEVDTSGTQLKSLYRATYAFFDPWIRATVLRQAIVRTQGFSQVTAQAQIEEDSVTYHFMHERIQNAAFETLFKQVRE